jgi:hypothetical protein
MILETKNYDTFGTACDAYEKEAVMLFPWSLNTRTYRF